MNLNVPSLIDLLWHSCLPLLVNLPNLNSSLLAFPTCREKAHSVDI